MAFFKANNFMVLCVMLCLLLISLGFPERNRTLFKLLFPVGLVLVSGASAISISTGRRQYIYAYVLAGTAGLMQLLSIFFNPIWFMDLFLVITVVFYGYILWRILHHLLHIVEVNQNTFYAAISGYLLIGICSALLVIALVETTENAYTNLAMGDLRSAFYYSFMTLTTIGYGDISPVHPMGRVLAMFVGMLGQFYLAVVMAILISKYTANISVPTEKKHFGKKE